MLINGFHIRIIHATTVEIIRLVDRLQRVGKDFKTSQRSSSAQASKKTALPKWPSSA
jgi:hypothetical protein